MKKYILLVLLTTVLGGVSSCSDDDTTSQRPAVEVLSAETNFTVLGGEQTVSLAATPASAYTQDNWAKAVVKGSQVVVNVDYNPNKTSRNTLLVIKNERGDSAALNIRQDGVIFGLPQDNEILVGDEAVERSFKISINIPTTYSGSESWMQVTKGSGNTLSIRLAANTTGKPRVGWVIAKASDYIDSLKVVQASLADVAGTYIQHSKTLRGTDMVDTTNVVTIERVSDISAKFKLDNNYVWEATFSPGEGFILGNGKVVREAALSSGEKVYVVSVLLADNFDAQHQNRLVGTKENIRITFNAKGELVFAEDQHTIDGLTLASYGWGLSTDPKVTMNTFNGLLDTFVQPKLIRQP